jgi:hypothetical protein
MQSLQYLDADKARIHNLVDVVTIDNLPYPPPITSASLPDTNIPVGTGSTSPPLKDSGAQITDVVIHGTDTAAGKFLRPHTDVYVGWVDSFTTQVPNPPTFIPPTIPVTQTLDAGAIATFDKDMFISVNPGPGNLPKNLLITNNTGGRTTIQSRIFDIQTGNSETSGNPVQILTSDGSRAQWQSPITQTFYASINAVPDSPNWVQYNGPIPYGSADYPGPVLSTDTDGLYFGWSPSNSGSFVNILRRGIYNVMAVQSISLSAGGALPGSFVPTNCRLRLTDGYNFFGNDTGRFQTTIDMANAGILTLNYQLNVVTELAPGSYAILAQNENDPLPGGTLLNKGSVVFTLLKETPSI